MLKNQVAIVTGVSSGIGRETALLLAERGARVFGTVRQRQPGESLPGVELVHLDVREDQSVRDAVAQLKTISRPPPKGFPKKFVVRFDVETTKEQPIEFSAN